jgi:hypothetical protein
MQYMHDNLNMHIVYVGKMRYLHYDFNPHYVWEMKLQYLHDNLNMHILCGAKCNMCIMNLNSHYLWEAKMQNPYVKHGTFLMEFYDHVKSIQRYWFTKIRNKTTKRRRK